jgi:hypothetical protein
MLCRMAVVRTDVLEELSASFFRVTRIGELGTTLAVTSNRRTLQRNTNRYKLIDLNYMLARPQTFQRKVSFRKRFCSTFETKLGHGVGNWCVWDNMSC